MACRQAPSGPGSWRSEPLGGRDEVMHSLREQALQPDVITYTTLLKASMPRA